MKILFKITAILLIQAFLLTDIGWAGSIGLDYSSKDEQVGTLSPQVSISAQSFQQIYEIYQFWSEHVPGHQALHQDFFTPESTLAALKTIPIVYRTATYLSKRYDEGGNPKLYKAYLKYKKILQKSYITIV